MQRYTNVAQDALGNVIQGMSVSVFLHGTQTLATIYSDNGITTIPNPITTDALGTFAFYAANGRYDLQFAKAGLPTTQLLDLLLNAAYVASVKDAPYNAKGDGVTDDTAALTAFRNALAVSPFSMGIFPAGTYNYTTSPNWAVAGLRIIAAGPVILNHTGTGNAWIFDGGSPSGAVYGCRMEGEFIISGNASSTNGLYTRAVHHSLFEARISNCATTGAGLRVDFAVVNTYRIRVSSNEAAFSNKPLYGMLLSNRGAGELTAYCTFLDCILEGLPTGIKCDQASGNVFLGGTSEGCSIRGVEETSNCTGNRFIKMDFEVNTTDDVLSAGRGTVFDQCDSSNLIHFIGGAWQEVRGGLHQNITIDAPGNGVLLDHLEFNRAGSSGSITDNGLNTTIRACRNGNGTLSIDKLAGFQSPLLTWISGTGAAAGLSVTASPFTHSNNSGTAEMVAIIGGTVSLVEHGRNSSFATFGTVSNTSIMLNPGDSVRVTYTVAPNMTAFPK